MNMSVVASKITALLADDARAFTPTQMWDALLYSGETEISLRAVYSAIALLPALCVNRSPAGRITLQARSFARPEELVALIARDDAGLNQPLLLTDARRESWRVELALADKRALFKSIEWAVARKIIALDCSFYGEQVRLPRAS